MAIILGIDPGSRVTGFGLINVEANRYEYIDSGCIRVAELEMPERLHEIYISLEKIILNYVPQEMAIEQVFVGKSADSALKLGHARGVAMVAGVNAGLPVSEYSARQVKQAVVGQGAADKRQVQHMVQRLLNLAGTPQSDAADALGVALCHANMSRGLARMAASRVRRKRLR